MDFKKYYSPNRVAYRTISKLDKAGAHIIDSLRFSDSALTEEERAFMEAQNEAILAIRHAINARYVVDDFAPIDLEKLNEPEKLEA